jgi:hypothetical protein
MREIESFKKAEKQYAREAGKKQEQATRLLQTEQKLQDAEERVKELEENQRLRDSFHGYVRNDQQRTIVRVKQENVEVKILLLLLLLYCHQLYYF